MPRELQRLIGTAVAADTSNTAAAGVIYVIETPQADIQKFEQTRAL